MAGPSVELLYFAGCPHVDAVRANLRAALEDPGAWREWDLAAPETPDRLKGYGSPTVLVDGTDVTGAAPAPGAALSCRADGVPTASVIREALDRRA